MTKQKVQAMNHEQAMAQRRKDEEMKKDPLYQYLNTRDGEGKHVHKNAAKIWNYAVNNPDEIMAKIRTINSLMHEVRNQKNEAERALQQYSSGDAITIRNKYGNIMDKMELYAYYITCRQMQQVYMAKIRDNIIGGAVNIEGRQQKIIGLLAMVDGKLMTFDMFDKYFEELEAVAKDLGHELFPNTVTVLSPK